MKDLQKVVVKKAFTLVELLVVMVIIGILIGLAVFGLSAAQKSARDTNRKNDARNMITALETYALKNGGAYPDVRDGTNIDPTLSVFKADNNNTVTNVALKSVKVQSLSNTVSVCTDGSSTSSIQTTFALVFTRTAGGAPDGFQLCVGLETEPTKGFFEKRGGDS